MSTKLLLKRIIIFITLIVFTAAYHCSVFAYENVTNPDISSIPVVSSASDTSQTVNATANITTDSDDPAIQELIKDIKPLPAPKATAILTSTGIQIYWTEVTSANGYKIFRRESGKTEWKELRNVSRSTLRTSDKTMTNGKAYTYAVCAYQDVKVTIPAKEPDPIVPPENESPEDPPSTEAPKDSETPTTPNGTEKPTMPDETEDPTISDDTENPTESGSTEISATPDKIEDPTTPGETESPIIPDGTENTDAPTDGSNDPETPGTTDGTEKDNDSDEQEIPDAPKEPETPVTPSPPITALVTVKGKLAKTTSIFWLTPSSVTKLKKSGTKMSTTWKSNPRASGYQIEYANNRFFEGASTITKKGAYTTSATITKLKKSSNYYVRVRGYTTYNGTKQYAPWSLSSNAKATKLAKTTRLTYKKKKKKVTFELRERSGYKVGSYDTLQGGCTDGTYGYFVLYNRKTQKCRIIKVKMSTMKVTKKSGAMKIYHGSDMTYNPDTKQLVVNYGSPYYKKIAIINPKTLKIIRTKNLELPSQIPGMSKKDRASYSGITALAYNTKYNQYVARLKGSGHLLVFDRNFTPLRFIYLSKKGGQLYQGMDTAGDYILVGQSFSSGKPYNIITVYDWTGAYISTVRVRKGYELENVFHAKGTFYSGFYTSGYKTVTVQKYKIKKVKGKKKRVKVKVKQRKLYRSNYIYKVTAL